MLEVSLALDNKNKHTRDTIQQQERALELGSEHLKLLSIEVIHE